MLIGTERGVHLEARSAVSSAAASEVHASLERLRSLGDACGQWCAAGRRTGVDWAWEHADEEDVLTQQKRL